MMKMKSCRKVLKKDGKETTMLRRIFVLGKKHVSSKSLAPISMLSNLRLTKKHEVEATVYKMTTNKQFVGKTKRRRRLDVIVPSWFDGDL